MKKIIITSAFLLGLTSCASPHLAKIAKNLASSDDPSLKALGSLIQSQRDVPIEEEIQIGNEISGGILGVTPLLKNSELQTYINDLGMWLALQTEQPNIPWRFGIIDTDDYNAFSMPGGVILISKGVLKRCKSESDLVAILSHEIAHVLKKHHIHSIQQESQNSGLVNAGKAATKNNNNEATTYLAEQAVKAGSDLYSRGLDKKDEYQADRMGMIIAARAGYNPYSLINVLNDIKSQDPQTSRFQLLFKTHPTPESRIDNLNKTIGSDLNIYRNNSPISDRFNSVIAELN